MNEVGNLLDAGTDDDAKIHEPLSDELYGKLYVNYIKGMRFPHFKDTKVAANHTKNEVNSVGSIVQINNSC